VLSLIPLNQYVPINHPTNENQRIFHSGIEEVGKRLEGDQKPESCSKAPVVWEEEKGRILTSCKKPR